MAEFTQSQRIAIDTTGQHLCVDAGAGSGKTGVLVERIVRLIETGLAGLHEIVAITFTDKAAAEMKQRLRESFKARASYDDPEAMTKWRDLERSVSSARISTIHTFCSGLLRENALALGLDPDFAMPTKAGASLLRAETVREALFGLLDEEDPPALRVSTALGIRKCVDAFEFMIARKTLMRRVVHSMPSEGVAALLEYQNSAIEVANERRLLSLGGSPEFRQLLRRLSDFDGLCSKPGDAREVARLDTIRLAASIGSSKSPGEIQKLIVAIRELEVVGTRSSNWPSKPMHANLKNIQDAIKELVGNYLPIEPVPEVDAAAAALACDVLDVYRRLADDYAARKRERSMLDYEDLIAGALDMLERRPDIRARTAGGIKHLLMDEFQDTDPAQLALAELLMRREGKPGAELFIVGDAKQSIYAFRGADVDVFTAHRKASDSVVRMDENFRTVPGILAFINDYFRKSGVMDTEEISYQPLVAARSAGTGPCIEFLVTQIEGKVNADEQRKEEAELIAGRVAAMISDGERISDKGAKGVRPVVAGDIAVLFRVASNIYLYEEALRRRGVSYRTNAGRGFFKRQEISDIRNLIALIVDPWDELALAGFLRSPIAALSDESLAHLCLETGLAKAFHSTVALAHGGENALLDAARRLLQELHQHVDSPLPVFMCLLLERTGFEAILLSQRHGAQKAANVRKLAVQAGDFDRASPATLRSFLRYLDEVVDDGAQEGSAPMPAGGGDAVVLSTIHSAKGLEFPVVVLADTARAQGGGGRPIPIRVHPVFGLGVPIMGPDGEAIKPAILRCIKRDAKEKDRAESARLLYVAMTRARDRLIIAGGKRDKGGNSWMADFDREYGILGAGDGALIENPGWAALVRNVVVEAPRFAGPATIGKLPERAMLALRIGPIVPPTERRIIPASTLLDAMEATGEDRTAELFAATNVPSGLTPQLRGSAVHALFEYWDFAPGTLAPVERALRAVRLPIPARRAIEADLHFIAERFAASPLHARLATCALIEREAAFLLRIEDHIISGVIDLVTDDGLIVDYKSGARRAATNARYEAQLRLYAAAARLRGKTPHEALLYYADLGDIVPVDISEIAIAATLSEAARHGSALKHVISV